MKDRNNQIQQSADMSSGDQQGEPPPQRSSWLCCKIPDWPDTRSWTDSLISQTAHIRLRASFHPGRRPYSDVCCDPNKPHWLTDKQQHSLKKHIFCVRKPETIQPDPQPRRTEDLGHVRSTQRPLNTHTEIHSVSPGFGVCVVSDV